MKWCPTCSQELPLDSFNWKNKLKGTHYFQCKNCWNASNKIRYQENKQYYVDKAKISKEKHRQKWKDFKRTLVCSRCGFDHPAAMQFHHTNHENKEFDIATAASKGWSVERLADEISKCEVLCANCHAIEHWNE